MTDRRSRLLRAVVRLYPEPFRRRYGTQLVRQAAADLSESGLMGRVRVMVNLVCAGCLEWIDHARSARLRRTRSKRAVQMRRPSLVVAMLDQSRLDVLLAARNIRRQPAFTLLAVLILSLGIGANTVIFGFISGLLIEPLPYESPDQLVRVYRSGPTGTTMVDKVSEPNARDWDALLTTLDGVAVLDWGSYDLSGDGAPEVLSGAQVSGNFFSLLGVQPHFGRVLARHDDQPDANRVVVLIHGFWQRRFGAQAAAVGRTLTLGGRLVVAQMALSLMLLVSAAN